MIKEKEISVNIGYGYINYYKDKGYDCKVGDTITIKIEDATYNSHARITAICDVCGH
jgi:hypothetical protein